VRALTGGVDLRACGEIVAGGNAIGLGNIALIVFFERDGLHLAMPDLRHELAQSPHLRDMSNP
jgi:hypothetical protein